MWLHIASRDGPAKRCHFTQSLWTVPLDEMVPHIEIREFPPQLLFKMSPEYFYKLPRVTPLTEPQQVYRAHTLVYIFKLSAATP